MNKWIPVSSGLFPDKGVSVQVTYIGYNTNEPKCNGFAYWDGDQWYWSVNSNDVQVKITAWKLNCGPYIEGSVDAQPAVKSGNAIKTVRCHYQYLADYCNQIGREHIISVTSAYGEQYGEHFFTIVYDTPELELKDC